MAAWETSTFHESEEAESIAALLSSDLSTSKFTLESENTGLWPICFGSKKNYISEKRLVRKCFTCQGRRRGCNRLDGRTHLRGQGAESEHCTSHLGGWVWTPLAPKKWHLGAPEPPKNDTNFLALPIPDCCIQHTQIQQNRNEQPDAQTPGRAAGRGETELGEGTGAWWGYSGSETDFLPDRHVQRGGLLSHAAAEAAAGRRGREPVQPESVSDANWQWRPDVLNNCLLLYIVKFHFNEFNKI